MLCFLTFVCSAMMRSCDFHSYCTDAGLPMGRAMLCVLFDVARPQAPELRIMRQDGVVLIIKTSSSLCGSRPSADLPV